MRFLEVKDLNASSGGGSGPTMAGEIFPARREKFLSCERSTEPILDVEQRDSGDSAKQEDCMAIPPAWPDCRRAGGLSVSRRHEEGLWADG